LRCVYHCDMAKGEGGGTGGGATGDEEALALGPQPLPELLEYRDVDDAATMKALGDPLRLKIMRVLGRDVRVAPRIMTVKQLAEELGEPTTKLYRHIKQLQAVGMIQVAELRLVGGIVEQSYRVAQKGWGVKADNAGLPRDQLSDEMLGVAGAALDEYLTRYVSALRKGRASLYNEENLAKPPHVRSVVTIADYRVPQERAAEFGDRLSDLVKEFNDGERSDAADAVAANLLVMFYATTPDDED
jgi:DNA-binding transcriptional ArsR family regulator